MVRLRLAVMRESSCRTDPAAALRGLANVGSPLVSRSSLIRRNSSCSEDHLAAHFDHPRDRLHVRRLAPGVVQVQRDALDGRRFSVMFSPR